MLRNLRKKRGQSTVEYAILIIIIIGALLSIQVYIKRGVQGRLKSAADDIGEQFSVGNTNYVMVTTSSSQTRETSVSGIQSSNIQGNEVTNITIQSNIIIDNQEYWG